MSNEGFAFSKINYILLAVAMIIVIIGFILMTGPSSTEDAFNPDIFILLRIKVAPMVCFFVFVFMVFAILYKPCGKCKGKTNEIEQEENV